MNGGETLAQDCYYLMGQQLCPTGLVMFLGGISFLFGHCERRTRMHACMHACIGVQVKPFFSFCVGEALDL